MVSSGSWLLRYCCSFTRLPKYCQPVNGGSRCRPCTSFSTLLSGKQFSPPWSYRMGEDVSVRIAKDLYCVRPSYRFFYVTVAYFLLQNAWFFDYCFRW